MYYYKISIGYKKEYLGEELYWENTIVSHNNKYSEEEFESLCYKAINSRNTYLVTNEDVKDELIANMGFNDFKIQAYFCTKSED